jgi:RND family efflux transporter MFP subunit
MPRLDVMATLTRRPWITLVAALGLVLAVVAGVAWRGPSEGDDLVVTVQRGDLATVLTLSGTLMPVDSTTYRSPLGGRETEITFLAPEGTMVNEGDLLARLDCAAIERELERSKQELRQANVEVQVADIDRQEALATIASLSEGEAALAVEEARMRFQQAEQRVARLRAEHDSLEPLLKKGYITKEELARVAQELDQAVLDLALTKRRSTVMTERTVPRDRQRADLLLAQKEAQRENALARVQDVTATTQTLAAQVEQCSVYARTGGLVVYEPYLNATPRRKVRIGDRVTESQGILTIPNVTRMFVDTSVAEAEMRRLSPGQTATVVLEAFPDRPLTGRVTRVGTLARTSGEGGAEDKRFDVSVEVDQPGQDLRPEMTARVDILSGSKTGVLLIPVTAVFDNGGTSIAYVVGRRGLETRVIQVGDSNHSFVEVVSGLTEGERVSLQGASSGGSRPASGGGGTMSASPSKGSAGRGEMKSLERR